MFTSARIKLTLWYLLIIMAVSIFFSLIIFQIITSELNRVENLQKNRQENQLSRMDQVDLPIQFRQKIPREFVLDPELIQETKNRIALLLLIINTAILISSGFAGYFLAGKTLKPIRVMVDEQKRFISDASHELRTPITALKTELEVSLKDKRLKSSVRKILESNLTEVNNLHQLTDDLIRLSLYEQNHIKLTNVDIKTILNAAILKVSAKSRQKQIMVENKTKKLLLKAEENSLTELFVILIDNAIKYSPPKTIVQVTSHVSGNVLTVNVKDHGIGISQKDIAHLFDRFYRADSSRNKTNVPGFGLGLSIAKQITQRHQGAISVSSQSNQGTVFSVSLPVS